MGFIFTTWLGLLEALQFPFAVMGLELQEFGQIEVCPELFYDLFYLLY